MLESRCNTIEVVRGRLLMRCDLGRRTHDILQKLKPKGFRMEQKGCHQRPEWSLDEKRTLTK